MNKHSFNRPPPPPLLMKLANRKSTQILEFASPSGLSFGQVILKNSKQTLNQIFSVNSESDRKTVSAPKRNFRHESEMLIVDFFNGRETNFGFTTPVGGSVN
jgi:hypothetical protein